MGIMLLRYLSERIMERWESLMITIIRETLRIHLITVIVIIIIRKHIVEEKGDSLICPYIKKG